jgi:predicted lipoprotein with Yx(FWY)xxD motif
MKRSLISMSGLAGVAVLAAACGSGSGGYSAGYGGSNAPATTPTTAQSATATTLDVNNSKLGSILADSHGRTVYLFGADYGSMSTCTSPGCVAEWPPLIANGSPQAGGGLSGNQLGTTTRADGQKQVTFSGHPLYYFAGDGQPGSTNGQGLNDNGGPWYVVRADGTPVVS